MTSQLLMSTSSSSESRVKAFPYQASHQAELLHLQAEAEALLLQVQTLKQQRSIAEPVGIGLRSE